MSERLSERALMRLLALAAEDDAPPPVPIPARYQILREIGRGGMGVVYEALDTQLGRHCALKTIGAVAGAGDELRRRFAREALAAARLRHPHVAAIYDATPDYISMQLIAGGPIDAIRPGERRLLVEMLRDAARALEHAHAQGIVHRDLKPSNLLVEARHVYVVDFGLAKEIAGGGPGSLSGAVLGTPAFMPPEQAQGRADAIDARSDVYSLGATLYRCLTGRAPFAHADLAGLLRRVIEDDPRPPGIERDLDRVILKCLAKEPVQRYAGAGALADDLERWLRGEPVHARRPTLAYRLRKLLQRRQALLRAAALAAVAAGLATALVLLPIAWRESAARAAAGAAVELAQRSATVLQDAAVFTRLGDLPSAQHELDAGIAEARAFLTRHEVARVRHLLSRLLRARGQPELALIELQRALAHDPGLDEARLERGLLIAGQPTRSAAEHATAVADLSRPVPVRALLTQVDWLWGRAELHRLEGRLEQAMETFQEVVALDSTHVAARISMAHVALALGDDELARHYSVIAVDLMQGYGPIYLARERRLLPATMLGLDGALVDFSEDLADGPDNALALAHRGLVHLRRTLRLETEGKRDQAIAAVGAAIEDHDVTLSMHTDLPGAFNNRAVCLMQAERLHAGARDTAAAATARARAHADLTRALAAAPDLPEALFNSGVLALRDGHALLHRGLAVVASQRFQHARQALGRALEHAAPDWPHRRACAARLAEAEAAPRVGG